MLSFEISSFFSLLHRLAVCCFVVRRQLCLLNNETLFSAISTVVCESRSKHRINVFASDIRFSLRFISVCQFCVSHFIKAIFTIDKHNWCDAKKRTTQVNRLKGNSAHHPSRFIEYTRFAYLSEIYLSILHYPEFAARTEFINTICDRNVWTINNKQWPFLTLWLIVSLCLPHSLVAADVVVVLSLLDVRPFWEISSPIR